MTEFKGERLWLSMPIKKKAKALFTTYLANEIEARQIHDI